MTTPPTADFLVEIGTEELPPKALLGLETAFAQGVLSGLAAAGLGHRLTESFGAPRRLALRGRHPFATYRLVYELDPEADGVRLRALTFADFPGLRGRVYRALVIGSGGHRIVVRRMLRRVADHVSRNPVCA